MRLGHDRGTDRNRRASDDLQEDQRDRQTRGASSASMHVVVFLFRILPPRTDDLSSQHKDKKRSIGLVASGSFHLPTEHDELLAENSVFCNEFGLASAKVCECSERQ
jgi:hypothetical protein